MSTFEKQQHTRETMALSLKLSELLYNIDYEASASLMKQGAMVEYAKLTLGKNNRDGMLYPLIAKNQCANTSLRIKPRL